jgi:hypothetical protein
MSIIPWNYGFLDRQKPNFSCERKLSRARAKGGDSVFSRVVIFPKISEKFEIFPKSFGNISIDFSRSENFSLECLAASMALDGYFEGFIVFQRE